MDTSESDLDKAKRIMARKKKELESECVYSSLGGIMDGQSAQEKLIAGASLLQIYTGFIYQGPGLIRKLTTIIQQSPT